MKNIIKWFVLLVHKDMQDFEMNEDTDCCPDGSNNRFNRMQQRD